MINSEESIGLPRIEKCKVYKIRWLILGIFVVYSAVNAMQWIQYSIISDVIVKYYGVSTTAVNWTSMIYMILYIPFIFPGSYILDRLVSFLFCFQSSFHQMKLRPIFQKYFGNHKKKTKFSLITVISRTDYKFSYIQYFRNSKIKCVTNINIVNTKNFSLFLK